MKRFIALLVVLAGMALLAGVLAGSAEGKAPTAQTAVVGWEARYNSKLAVRNEECGKKSWWWVCHSVSNAVCRGGGGGTWHCYLAFTERLRPVPWKLNVCDSYVYVNRAGATTNPSRTNCKRIG
jgi:hypothetical protein